ncbi:MAG: hypothetical protein GX654_12050 [Desulfatiglans sp.]|jgi:hypothetical protein|nr:hypothetical protein [Desulfatiglans sp.]
MIHENELVMLLLSLGVAVFIILKRHKFRQFFGWKLLFTAFLFFTTGCICTVLETLFFNNLLNHLEHICYLINALMIMMWCFRAIGVRGGKNE